jgi:hypothetical protein
MKSNELIASFVPKNFADGKINWGFEINTKNLLWFTFHVLIHTGPNSQACRKVRVLQIGNTTRANFFARTVLLHPRLWCVK